MIEPTGGALFAQTAKRPYSPAFLICLATLMVMVLTTLVRRSPGGPDRLDRVTVAVALGGAGLAVLTVLCASVLMRERLDPLARLRADLARLPAAHGGVLVVDRVRASRNGFDQPSVLRSWEVQGRPADQICADESGALARLGGQVRTAGLRPIPGRAGPECVIAAAFGRDLVTVGVRVGHAPQALTDVAELSYIGGFTGTDVATVVRQATAERP
ncbi:MAG: hypothetical protein NVSMB13_00200 [Mycobacteriales bacterium]